MSRYLFIYFLAESPKRFEKLIILLPSRAENVLKYLFSLTELPKTGIQIFIFFNRSPEAPKGPPTPEQIEVQESSRIAM